jgi:hypothetical protein
MDNHPLSFNSKQFTQEINVGSLIGKVLAGAMTAIAVRWVIERIDDWTGRAKR